MVINAQRSAAASPPQELLDEPARLAAVRRYQILDSPPDGAFDRVASLAAAFFKVPIATVTIVDEDRIWFKAAHGLPGVSEIAREPGLCASVIAQDGLYLVTDAATDARTAGNPLVVGELGVRFYAAAPITTQDGYRLGTVNVIDTKAREITADQTGILTDLAAIVMDQLELRLAALRTVSAERRLRERAERAARTLKSAMAAAGNPRLDAGTACELGNGGTDACVGIDRIRIVDLTGASAWGCPGHAAEALATVSGTFVASPDAPSIASITRS
jgi:sigma-B regulation protein RsbU (phosphoserine phosphatase)